MKIRLTPATKSKEKPQVTEKDVGLILESIATALENINKRANNTVVPVKQKHDLFKKNNKSLQETDKSDDFEMERNFLEPEKSQATVDSIISSVVSMPTAQSPELTDAPSNNSLSDESLEDITIEALLSSQSFQRVKHRCPHPQCNASFPGITYLNRHKQLCHPPATSATESQFPVVPEVLVEQTILQMESSQIDSKNKAGESPTQSQSKKPSDVFEAMTEKVSNAVPNIMDKRRKAKLKNLEDLKAARKNVKRPIIPNSGTFNLCAKCGNLYPMGETCFHVKTVKVKKKKKVFWCRHCLRNFNLIQKLKHTRDYHEGIPSSLLHCAICNVTFTCKDIHDCHIRAHNILPNTSSKSPKQSSTILDFNSNVSGSVEEQSISSAIQNSSHVANVATSEQSYSLKIPEPPNSKKLSKQFTKSSWQFPQKIPELSPITTTEKIKKTLENSNSPTIFNLLNAPILSQTRDSQRKTKTPNSTANKSSPIILNSFTVPTLSTYTIPTASTFTTPTATTFTIPTIPIPNLAKIQNSQPGNFSSAQNLPQKRKSGQQTAPEISTARLASLGKKLTKLIEIESSSPLSNALHGLITPNNSTRNLNTKSPHHVVERSRIKSFAFHCPLCPTMVRFDNRDKLSQHLDKSHNADAKSSLLVCDVCGMFFKDLAPLTAHLRLRHSKEEYCIYCRRSFTTSNFVSHVQEKGQCTVCNSKFVSKCLLNQHITLHLAWPTEKP